MEVIKMQTNNFWKGEVGVRGLVEDQAQTYNVSLYVKGGRVKDYSCSCAEGNSYKGMCAHGKALFAYYEDYAKRAGQPPVHTSQEVHTMIREYTNRQVSRIMAAEEAEKADLANPEIREGMKLYLDSLQLMTLTIKPVVQYTLENATADAVEKLQYDVRQLGKNRNGYKIFEVVLTFIAENCRLNLVKECYNKLRELIVWGYPIALLRLREREFHMEYNDMVDQAGRYLGEGNAEAFSGSVKESMGREYQEVRIFLESADTRQ